MLSTVKLLNPPPCPGQDPPFLYLYGSLSADYGVMLSMHDTLKVPPLVIVAGATPSPAKSTDHRFLTSYTGGKNHLSPFSSRLITKLWNTHGRVISGRTSIAGFPADPLGAIDPNLLTAQRNPILPHLEIEMARGPIHKTAGTPLGFEISNKVQGLEGSEVQPS